MDDKQFFNTLKAIMYQLYSRKLMFIVFTGDPNKRADWLFSNVDRDTMLVYDESSEYHFSKVTIKDNDFLDMFYKKFPILLNNPAIIRVVDFCSPLSKAEALSDCELSNSADSLAMTFSMKNKTNPELVLKDTKDCGFILQDIEVDMYYTVWKSGLVKSENPFHLPLSVTDITDDKGALLENRVIVVQDIANPTDNFKAQHAMVIMQPGYTVPTLPAFVKSVKNQSSEFELIAGYDTNSVIVNCSYDTTLLSCIGTHPAQRWFVKDRR